MSLITKNLPAAAPGHRGTRYDQGRIGARRGRRGGRNLPDSDGRNLDLPEDTGGHGEMISASQLAVVAAGVFFLVGLLTGTWKYLHIRASADGCAPSCDER